MQSSTYYFHMKTTISTDFQICISAPLLHPFSNSPNNAVMSSNKFHNTFCGNENILGGGFSSDSNIL